MIKIMKRLAFLSVTVLTLVAFITPSTALALGATQISGIAYWPNAGQCTDPEGAGSNYAVLMTGDLRGCHYTFVQTAVCSPGGVYEETGTETFVGQYKGVSGSFRTTYRFTATYADCAHAIGELVGRCEHPIIAGSGKGVFTDVTGRIDMKDDVAAGDFLYRGHLQW